jgi:AsmA protein
VLKKILYLAIALTIVIVIALTVVIKIYVTPESVKSFLIPEAEKALQRKVSLGGIDISLLKGIHVRDFVIKESDGKTDFISCDDFIFRYKLLPLLSRKIIVEEVKLVSPRVRIERNQEGTFNFEDIGKREQGELPEDEQKDGKPGGLPISLLVDSIIVDNARFFFLDAKEELPDMKGSLDINLDIKSMNGSELHSQGNIDVKVEEILLKKPQKKQIRDVTAMVAYKVSVAMKSKDIRIDTADVTIQEIPLSISGTVINLQTSPEIDIALSLPVTKIEDIDKVIDPFIDTSGLNLSGSLMTELNLTGMLKRPETVIASGNMTFDDIRATYKNIPLSIDGSIQSDIQTNSILIKNADFTLQGVQAIIKGTVKNLKTSPEMDLTISIPSVKTAELEKSMKTLIGKKGGPLSGNLTADFNLKGMLKKLDSLKTDGTVTLQKFGMTYNDVPVIFDGNLFLKEQSVGINTNIILGKNTTSLKGSVNNYLEKPDIRLNLHAQELALDHLIPAGAGKDTAPPGEEELSAEGEIKIDKAQYKSMTMTDFYTNYSFKNNIFKISKMIARAGKGTLNLNSTVDFTKPGYTYSLKSSLDSLHANEVVNAFLPKAKDTVFGLLSVNLSLKGKGTLSESMKKNLTGGGDFHIEDGKIMNSSLPENLALFLGIDELKTIHIRKGEGTLKINNGIARLKSILSSDDIKMDPAGKIGLDETLDLAFDIKLSPRLTDKAMMKSNIASYMKDEAGWGTIPLKVSGTFANPSYRVDVEKAGKRILKKEADKLIDKLFEKKDDEKGEGGKKEEPDPVKDLLKGILK